MFFFSQKGWELWRKVKILTYSEDKIFILNWEVKLIIDILIKVSELEILLRLYKRFFFSFIFNRHIFLFPFFGVTIYKLRV